MEKNEKKGAGCIAGPRGHILQSREWQEFEKSEGREVFECAGAGWSARGIVEKTRAGKYLYAKYGPEIRVEGEKNGALGAAGGEGGKIEILRAALAGLAKEAKKRGAIFVRVEPTCRFTEEEMASLGCRRSKEIDPEHTWILSLKGNEEEILAGMESNKVRSRRNAKKHGMRVRKSVNPEEIGILTRFLAGVGQREHFTPQEEGHLRRQLEAGFASLFVVEYSEKMAEFGAQGGEKGPVGVGDGKDSVNGLEGPDFGDFRPIAAALVYDWGGVRYYAHAGADENYLKLRAGAVLLVEMILDAKKSGESWFDFWGITTSEDTKHPWYGFTQFKKSFGGCQVDYTGTYDLIVDEKRYRLYKTLRKANLALRKLKK